MILSRQNGAPSSKKKTGLSVMLMPISVRWVVVELAFITVYFTFL